MHKKCDQQKEFKIEEAETEWIPTKHCKINNEIQIWKKTKTKKNNNPSGEHSFFPHAVAIMLC